MILTVELLTKAIIKKTLNRIKMNQKTVRTKVSFKKPIAHPLKPVNFAVTTSDESEPF